MVKVRKQTWIDRQHRHEQRHPCLSDTEEEKEKAVCDEVDNDRFLPISPGIRAFLTQEEIQSIPLDLTNYSARDRLQPRFMSNFVPIDTSHDGDDEGDGGKVEKNENINVKDDDDEMNEDESFLLDYKPNDLINARISNHTIHRWILPRETNHYLNSDSEDTDGECFFWQYQSLETQRRERHIDVLLSLHRALRSQLQRLRQTVFTPHDIICRIVDAAYADQLAGEQQAALQQAIIDEQSDNDDDNHQGDNNDGGDGSVSDADSGHHSSSAQESNHSVGGHGGNGGLDDSKPNPIKLVKIGLELKKVLIQLQQHHEVQIVNHQLDVNEIRNARHSLINRTKWLRKKAQIEANKIIIYGLGLEHEKLLQTWFEMHKAIANGSAKTAQDMNHIIHCSGPRFNVSGNSAGFVNFVLDNVTYGLKNGGIDKV